MEPHVLHGSSGMLQAIKSTLDVGEIACCVRMESHLQINRHLCTYASHNNVPGSNVCQ